MDTTIMRTVMTQTAASIQAHQSWKMAKTTTVTQSLMKVPTPMTMTATG